MSSKEKYILAIDQGTTSCRAILFDNHATAVDSAQQPFEQIYPQHGWVEHSPEVIFDTQLAVIKKVVADTNIDAVQIAALGITNQRETTIVWERATGKPIFNAIVWQCHRTADMCDNLKERGLEQLVYDKTGLPIDAYFSATKISWILKNVDGARQRAERGELCFGTVDTYLMFRLSCGAIFATDYTNASRTLLFNIHTLQWDDELLQLFDIPKVMLPSVCPSSFDYGVIDKSFLGVTIPICGVAGDQQASLFGNLCVKKGMVKNTYGTGCFTLMNTGDIAVESKRGLITTLSACLCCDRPQYVLEGSVFVGSAVLQWLRDEMKMISSAREADIIAENTPDTNGVYIVPAFVGLGAPHWAPKASGMVCGLTRGAKREHFVRACLESIAYQVFDVVHAMEADLGEQIKCLKVDGGGSVSDVLMQFQADILNSLVHRPTMIEATALGVCFLAGIKCGMWKSVDEIERNCVEEKTFCPTMPQDKAAELIMGWEKAVARSKFV